MSVIRLLTFRGIIMTSWRIPLIEEIIPKYQEEENSIYGNVWIDLEDYSILKIEADPRSINGYQSLKNLEKRLNARLFLTLEIQFDEVRNGIRFPTEVLLLEKYKGGRYVSTYKGSEGWERNRTTFSYTDYRFFDVKVEVSIDNRWTPRRGEPICCEIWGFFFLMSILWFSSRIKRYGSKKIPWR